MNADITINYSTSVGDNDYDTVIQDSAMKQGYNLNALPPPPPIVYMLDNKKMSKNEARE